MSAVLAGLDPANYQVHALHDPARNWPETNCYTDLWIEVLNALRLPPEAMLGFTVRQDFEGDQFTFFKTPLEDLERLFDIRVTELAIFDNVERHILTQIARGRMSLVEVDSHWLPDTRGVTYRTSHGKTTIGINSLDREARRMTYFHNAGFFGLQGEDYDGVFGRLGHPEGAVQLFPYVEFAKFPERPHQPSLAECEELLAWHLARRPLRNPFRAWLDELPAHLEDLAQRPEGYFHTYAFNTLRQFGANFDLLASHLEYLHGSRDPSPEIEAARTISTSAKTMQFQLARAMARRKMSGLDGMITPMIDAWDLLMSRLDARNDVRRAA